MKTSQQAKRINYLDTLRGFSLLGILAVNLPWFSHNILADPAVATTADRMAVWLVAFAGQAKFFVLFSFLFGYGMAVQLERSIEDGQPLGPRYFRRLTGLFLFGLIHAVFLFLGDILICYAILGTFLWFCRNWSIRNLLIASAIAYFLSIPGYGLLGAISALDAGPEWDNWLAQGDEAYLGSFWDAARQRTLDYFLFVLPIMILFNCVPVMAMFALGLAAGKARFFQSVDQHLPLLKRLLPWTVIVGVIGNALYATVFTDFGSNAMPASIWSGVLAMTTLALSWPALAYSYMIGILLLERRTPAFRFLQPLRSAGHMSLTNYMSQSVLAGFVFLGWGLGFYGKVGPMGCLLLTPVIYGILIAFSSIWLRYFHNGPEEWLLRCWTYWRWQPFCKPTKTP
ncbi:MAG: hypothetical protein M2R45_04036 [Verrucomicrobia subdivision 3 bacterium]|nr:hypothetical protein [Limisphaerales bacterium]MCS1416980.1 hypothetical protein [Limisphaerales bacterium]